MSEILENINTNTSKRKSIRSLVFYGMVVVFALTFYFLILRGPTLKEPISIHISKGDKIAVVAKKLEDKNIVRSAKLLQSFVSFLDGDGKIKTGDYYFDKPMWLPGVAYRIARGVHNVDAIRVTFPEGSDNTEIAKILNKKLPAMDVEKFALEIDNLQGELFPDTYFFYPLTTFDEVASILKDTFNQKTQELLAKGYKDYTKQEILVMASIIEKEANGKEDRNIISGILWKRLEKGMLLQVDVAPVTYKVKGLPDKPITNSGIASIEAAINPEESKYLFYLHDKNGTIHLAETFAGHKSNINKYLR